MQPLDNGKNCEQQPKLYQKIGAVDVSKTDTLSQNIEDISNDIGKTINSVFSEESDGQTRVTKKESAELDLISSYLCNLSYRIKNAMQNAVEEVKAFYQQMSAKIESLINDTLKAAQGKNPYVQKKPAPAQQETTSSKERTSQMENNQQMLTYEPDDTDADDFDDIPESYRQDIKKINQRYSYYRDMELEELHAEVQRRLEQANKDKLAGTTFTKEQIAEIGQAIKEARSEDDLKKRLITLGFSEEYAEKVAKG